MAEREASAIRDFRITWVDLIWLAFLGGLALLPPVDEIHKQLILLAFLIIQVLEGWMIAQLPERGAAYSVFLKILLATLLLDHTGEIGINSSYFPIYFLPVVSAAIYFGTIGTLVWTTVASLAYLSLLLPVMEEVELTPEGKGILAIRVLFFYVAAILVNRFAVENRRQVQRLEDLSAKLEETNRQLRRAEADARRAERLAALGQLSAGLAHEIRNPLGVIKGSADMLSRKVAASEPLTAELAGYISSEVNRLNALVTRFLDFARPSQAGSAPRADHGNCRSRAGRRHALRPRLRSENRAGVRREPAGNSRRPAAVRTGVRQPDYQRPAGHAGAGRLPRETAAAGDRTRGIKRRAGGRHHRRGHRAGRAARIARADFQSVFHFQEGRRGAGAFHCRENRGRPSRLDSP